MLDSQRRRHLRCLPQREILRKRHRGGRGGDLSTEDRLRLEGVGVDESKGVWRACKERWKDRTRDRRHSHVGAPRGDRMSSSHSHSSASCRREGGRHVEVEQRCKNLDQPRTFPVVYAVSKAAVPARATAFMATLSVLRSLLPRRLTARRATQEASRGRGRGRLPRLLRVTATAARTFANGGS